VTVEKVLPPEAGFKHSVRLAGALHLERRQDERRRMFDLLIQCRPFQAMAFGQVGEIEISGFGPGGCLESVQSPQITRHERRL